MCELDHFESFIPDAATMDDAFNFVSHAPDSSGDKEQREAGLKCLLGRILPGNREPAESLVKKQPSHSVLGSKASLPI